MQLNDLVYIGTGPISVIDAVCNKVSGDKVLMVDNKSEVGGAWIAIAVGDFGKIEVGCHIWSYNKTAYQFLEDFFELELIELKPFPQFVNGRKRINYDYKNSVITMQRVAGHLKRARLKNLYRYIRKNPSARIPILPKKYLYPKGGGRAFQNAISQKITKFEIPLYLNCDILEIEMVGDIWHLKKANGEVLHAKKIVLTSTSSLKKIVYKGSELILNQSRITYTHFHLVIDQKLKTNLSYLRILDDSLIHRISDVTHQLESNENDDKSVLLVGVFNDGIANLDSNISPVEYILNYLKSNSWLHQSAVLVYSQRNEIDTSYISKDDISKINDIDESLTLIQTTDLVYGVHHQLRNWKVKL